MTTDMTLFGFGLRWMVTFLGFPLGGAAAYALVRSVDTPLRGLLGGLIAGAILGLAQWL
ncbi:MAG: hypothetical protein H7Z42_13880, partial [Roseiflexaceae bacterium]|nr:hypothetical protein [Roseiflexaceae bacterium]